jgi:RNA polymerase sigma factor (sigma-70 family)
VSLPPFQLLVERHGPEIRRYLAVAAGPLEADDCWQETFLAALRAYPSLRDGRNLRGWLYAIASRKALDEHRDRRRRPEPRAVLPEEVVGERSPPEPALWRAVRRLPGKQRAAVALRFAGDLDYARIGKIIGCSEAAARQNVRAGLASMRKEWSR